MAKVKSSNGGKTKKGSKTSKQKSTKSLKVSKPKKSTETKQKVTSGTGKEAILKVANKSVKIDKSNLSKIKDFHFRIENRHGTVIYYDPKTKKKGSLANLLFGKKGKALIYKNKNHLDLRKENIMVVTNGEKSFYNSKMKNKAAGVIFRPEKRKWYASLNGKYLGYAKTKKEALELRSKAEWKKYKRIMEAFFK